MIVILSGVTISERHCIRVGPGLHEHVAQDPDGSHWRGDVQTHEAREADLLAARLDLHDVVLARQGELLTPDDKVDVGQAGGRFNHGVGSALGGDLATR